MRTPIPYLCYPGSFYFDENPYEPRYYTSNPTGPYVLTELQTSLNRSESHAQAPIESTFSTSPYAMSSTYKYPHSHPLDPMYYASMYETQYNSLSSYASMEETQSSSSSPYPLSMYEYSHNSHNPRTMYYASLEEALSSSSSYADEIEETQSSSLSPYNFEPTFNNHFSSNNDHQSFSIASTPQLGSSSTLLDFFGLFKIGEP
ncbi:unnamed protein product [Sphagnum troendelagicum]